MNIKPIFAVSALIPVLASCAVPEFPADTISPAVTSAPAAPTAAPTETPTVLPAPDYDALSSKVIGWGIKKNKHAAPDIPADVAEMCARHSAYYADLSGERTLYLTFDEGYENGYTAAILDILKSEGVPAAFFVTAPYLKTETELVNRMIDEGHIVGNHTARHSNLATDTLAEAEADIADLAELFAELYGGEMKYLRPPEGSYSERTLALSEYMGYKTIFWSFAYKDWDPSAQRGAEYAYESVTEYLHDGAVILLHAVSRDNAEALGDIIRYAKSEGYTFKSLEDLTG